jgi:hypothetical protein
MSILSTGRKLMMLVEKVAKHSELNGCFERWKSIPDEKKNGRNKRFVSKKRVDVKRE